MGHGSSPNPKVVLPTGYYVIISRLVVWATSCSSKSGGLVQCKRTPPGTADSLVLIGVGPGYPSLIAGETYVGVLVVSDSGELSELYRTGDGAWNWVSIGPPMGRRNPRVAVSDPSYVGVAMGYRGGFMNGLDGHLYEASASGSGHDWTWTDHGA